MANVVGLRGAPIPAPLEPDHELVEKLESLLERARTGKIRAIAFTVIDFDDSFSTGWSGEASLRAYLGGAALLQYRLAKEADGG